MFIIGWDVDSRVRLTGPGTEPVLLLPWLNQVLSRRPELRVFVLGWDFSVIYTFERQLLPAYRFAWRGHPRLRFQLDGVHPLGASHHQKIVVIDDRVAFAGGLDLAIRRWDDPRHLAANPDRVDPSGQPYPPIHDVQMAVDGEAAQALGEIARERWLAATGERLAPPAPASPADGPHPWPGDLAPDASDVPIGICRTDPGHQAAPRVCEVLNLTLDAIGAAERSIYIENQYLTSAAVGQALAARLAEPDGPEVAVVLPRAESGWLEQSSMGIMRTRLLRRLRAADHHQRLRLYYPTVPGLAGACVNLHSKVLVVDERLLRIGSSNLSNRSMGLDTECDLVIDATGQRRLGETIARFRHRLLAEHLGSTPEAVAAQLASAGSLLRAIDALRGGERTLALLPVDESDEGSIEGSAPSAGAPAVNLAFLDGLVCDPERPAPDQLVERFVPAEYRRPVHRSLLGYATLLLAIFALAAIWRFTPLRQYLDVGRVAALGVRLRGHPAAPLLVLAAYLVGALVFFPVTALLAATALIFDPLRGLIYSLVGAWSGAMLTYAIGRLLGRKNVVWLSGPRLSRVRDQLQRRGLIAVVTARMLPVGNFSLINLMAGALSIRLRDFMLGNLIGLLPGVLGLALFANRLASTLRNPRPRNLLVLAALVLAILAVVGGLRRRLVRRRSAERAGRDA